MNDRVMDTLAELPDIEAWTIDEAQSRVRHVTSRLLEAVREQRDIGHQYASAEADYRASFHQARLTSYSDPERADWTVARHESWAEVQAVELDTARIILKERKSALRSEVDALKTVVEALRSHVKTARELSGGRSNQ